MNDIIEDLESVLKEMLDLYSDGRPISEIGDTVGMTEDSVLDVLQQYRKNQKVGGSYTDTLMKLVAQRDRMGVQRKMIMGELTISRTTLVKAIKKYGFMNPIEKEVSEEIVGRVGRDYVFTECPDCSSKHINKVETMNGELAVEGIYCFDCGNEFFESRGNLYKVKWENVD